MDSKFKEKVEELFHLNSKIEEYCNKEQCVKVMCQLAEEVEKEFEHKAVNMYINTITKAKLYTKEQVEELLQKQRELCAEKAEIYEGRGGSIVLESSILNAKLKID